MGFRHKKRPVTNATGPLIPLESYFEAIALPG